VESDLTRPQAELGLTPPNTVCVNTLYGDDTHLYLVFDLAEADIAIKAMAECITGIRQWTIDKKHIFS
jgi:hypothetical protein